jgi:hypothetical protein
MTSRAEHRTGLTILTAGIVAAATLGLASSAAALPADQVAGPAPTTATQAEPARVDRPGVNQLPTALLGKTPVFTFTLNNFRITNTRSVHEDTDFVSISVVVGSNAPIHLPTKSMGNLNNGTYPVNLTIPNVAVAPGENVAFSYSIVNTGFAANSTEADLTKATDAAATAAASAGGGLISAGTGTAVGSAAGGWLGPKIAGIIFADCDGPVAAGDHAWTGAALAAAAMGKTVTTEDNNPGTDSPTGCGSNSQYYVNWSVSGAEAVDALRKQ